MAHGGKRNGGGRKKGVPNKKTQAVIDKAEAEGIMPKDVLLHAMRWCYAKGDFIKAADIAKDAAPYFTPRLSAITLKGDAEQPIRLVEEFAIIDGNANPSTPPPS